MTSGAASDSHKVPTYSNQLQTLTKETSRGVRLGQKAMMRDLLRKTLLYPVRRTEIHLSGLGSGDEPEWSWEGHLARHGDGRWSRAWLRGGQGLDKGTRVVSKDHWVDDFVQRDEMSVA